MNYGACTRPAMIPVGTREAALFFISQMEWKVESKLQSHLYRRIPFIVSQKGKRMHMHISCLSAYAYSISGRIWRHWLCPVMGTNGRKTFVVRPSLFFNFYIK